MAEHKFFIPDHQPNAGSLFGSSYINLASKCWKKWFNTYYRPITSSERGGEVVARGIAPIQTSAALLSGRVFHEGLAAYYVSGCRDGEDTGEYDVERALEVAQLVHLNAKKHGEYQDDSAAEEDWLLNKNMLLGYADFFGPRAPSQDYPNIRIACDGNGQPLVEREFKMALDYGDYVYSCKYDAIVHHRGFLKAMEHKTSAAGFVGNRIKTSQFDAQITGECAILADQFPDDPIHGVLMNVVVKKRSVNSKFDPAERESTTRTQTQLEYFRLSTVSLLAEIDHRVGEFERELEKGTPLELAAQVWFPDHGTRSGECMSYNYPCTFAAICQLPGRERATLTGFRPRSGVEIKEMREWNH